MKSHLVSALGAQRFLGVPVEAHAILDSTNDEALRRARDGAREGLVVAAERQTAGRGRHGRSWFGDPGRSLLFSVLLEPKIPLPSYPLLGLALACSVAEAGGEAVGAALDLKWPNDVVHAGRKLCGVLAESRAPHTGAPPALVVGAGVNVNQLEGDFPAEIRSRATSLRIAAGGREIDITSLLEATLARYEGYLAAARGADPRPLFDRVRPRLPARGTPVRVLQSGRIVEGTVEEVTELGALRVREADGGVLSTVSAGDLL